MDCQIMGIAEGSKTSKLQDHDRRVVRTSERLSIVCVVEPA